MREARAQLDALIGQFKVGESIFSYPGLITLGRIRHIDSTDGKKEWHGTYFLEFIIGFSDSSSGGSETRFYQVHFDQKGVILDHRALPRMTE